MKIIETTFERLPRERLEIGFEGENQRATVRIDCASVFAEYPNATPALIVKPLFADAYPVVVDRNGTDVDWLITSEILSFSGDGEIQLVFYKDQVICKSAVSKIRVSRSLQVTGEKPDPIARWEDAANQKLAEVDAVIVSIDEMDATAHGLPEGSAPTAEVQDIDDHKRISFGIPKGDTGEKGDKGDKGDRGEVGATPQIGIGTVQTLPAGSSATASMSGTTENPLLNLGIPQGIQGVKGDRGEKGDTGATGATGATPDLSIGTVSTLPAGSSATAEITGTAENPVLSLGIPQGIQGVQGVQGEKGEKGDPGDGTPAGGLTDQVLAKASDTDHDTKWMYVAPVIKNEASGSIASFLDGADGYLVDELKVKIEPVQDLNGYDHPWPGGGNRNLLDLGGQYTIAQAGSVVPTTELTKPIPAGTYTVAIKSSGAIAWQVIFTDSNGNSVGSFASNGNNAGRQSKTGTLTDTAYNVRIYVNGGTTISEIQFESGSTATDYVPYANICPISGFDSVKVTRTGSDINGFHPCGGYISDGIKSYNATANTFYLMVVPCEPNKTYTVVSPVTLNRFTTGWITQEPATGVPVNGVDTTVATSRVIQTGDNAKYLVCYYWNKNVDIGDAPDMCVNLGNDTTYHAYQGQTYDITLPTEAGTVYGGELTINDDGSGSLVVDRVKRVFDGSSDENIGPYNSGYDGFYIRVDDANINGTPAEQLKANYLVGVPRRGDTTGYKFAMKTYSSPSDNKWFFVSNTGITDYYEFKAYLANNNLEVLYPLAEPITYTLTPTEIRTLLGQNNVWADTGDVSVKYNADTKLYIDGKIAELVAQIVNS